MTELQVAQMRIDSISLTAFRGATGETKINFDPTKRITLIYGENGTGKSSIVDAIEMVCKENSGSLEGRSLDGTKKHTHLKSLGKRSSDVSVAMGSNEVSWRATVGANGPATSGPASRPDVYVLRRFRLMKLTEATAGDKYEQLASFVNVQGVDLAEESLVKALKSAQDSLNAAVGEQTNALRTLSTIWTDLGSPGAPAKDCRQWALEQTTINVAELRTKQAAIRAAHSQMQLTDTEAKNHGILAKQVSDVVANKEALQADPTTAASIGVQEQLDLMNVLRGAARYIAQHSDLDKCPVCETPQDMSRLSVSIQERIDSFRTGSDHVTKLEALLAEEQRLNTLLASTSLRLVHVSQKLLASWTTARAAAESLTDLTEFAEISTFTEGTPTRVELCLALNEATQAVSNTVAEIDTDITNQVDRYTVVQRNINAVLEAEAKSIDYQRKATGLQAILDVMRPTRLNFAQSILDNVHADCDVIYKTIHPDEELGTDGLMLDPNKRASIKQTAHFGAHKDVIPAAYFSESHSDTLGLALFVAIAKRQSNGAGILVLDDVFTSVDGPHLERIINMITDQAEHFTQVIVTTHFRRMYDRFRQNKAEMSDLKELDRWKLNTGINVHESHVEIGILRQFLDLRPLDRNSIASKAGYILDSALDHLVQNYQCTVPKVPGGENTLKELYDGFTKVAKNMNVQQGKGKNATWEPVGPATIIAPFYEKLKDGNLVRHEVGAHHKEIGSDYSEGEVTSFGEDVYALLAALICTECKCLPTQKKDAHWQCGCGACRSTPVNRQ